VWWSRRDVKQRVWSKAEERGEEGFSMGCALGRVGCSPEEGMNTCAGELWVRKRRAGVGQIWEEKGWDLTLAVAGWVEQVATLPYPFHVAWTLA